MKIKFKKQTYQTNAVESVADCFVGQPKTEGSKYRVDPGRGPAGPQRKFEEFDELEGFKNAAFALPKHQILKNIQQVQRSQNLPMSSSLASD